MISQYATPVISASNTVTDYLISGTSVTSDMYTQASDYSASGTYLLETRWNTKQY